MLRMSQHIENEATNPASCWLKKFGVTLSLPGVVGRDGVAQVLQPMMTRATIAGTYRLDNSRRPEQD